MSAAHRVNPGDQSMRIVICDDDTVFTQVFARQLREACAAEGASPEIVCTDSGMAALREITLHPTAALFLDIDMPEMTGFSVANELSLMADRPLIVFLSGLENLVYKAFAFQPFWFLRKSAPEDLPEVVRHMISALSGRQTDFTVSINGTSMRVPLSDIRYFESDGHYVILHGVERDLRFKARIGDIEAELKNRDFIRCHVGYLVNCRFIRICSRNRMTLTTGEEIPVSRAKSEEAQAAFMRYMGSLRP